MQTIYFEAGITYDVKDETIEGLRTQHPSLDVHAELEKLQRFIYEKAIAPSSPRDFVRNWFETAVTRLGATARIGARPAKTCEQIQAEKQAVMQRAADQMTSFSEKPLGAKMFAVTMKTYAERNEREPNNPEHATDALHLIETGMARV
jgi:hypothetical protein